MLKRRGQSSMEFATLFIIVLAAFLTVGVYFKRGIQGRWKTAVDNLGDQYDPRLANTDLTSRISSSTFTQVQSTDVAGGLWTTRQDVSNTIDTRSGSMTIGAAAAVP